MNQIRFFFVAIVCLFFSFRGYGQYGTIIPIVSPGGTDNSSNHYAGDGGLAKDSAVRFNQISSMSLDSAGDIFLSDSYIGRIRKINKATGILNTIAGNGTSGFSGDGGPAPLAQLNFSTPYNSFNNYGPTACADRVGNCYICDAGNLRIRKVDHNTGFITTIAGNGVDTFSGDGGLAINAGMIPILSYVNSNGDIFVFGNNRLRKITAATGIITTIAGNAVPGNETNGPAINSSLAQISGITGDAAGNIYCTDWRSCRIFKIDNSGVLTILFGATSPGATYCIPWYSCSSSQTGNAYSNGSSASVAGGSCTGIGLDSSGNIFFISDNSIRKINAATGIVNKVAGNIYNLNNDPYNTKADSISMSPTCIVVDRTGNIYYTDANGMINKIVGAASAINTLSVKDSVVSPSCSLPAQIAIYITGTVNGIPATTDSVTIMVDYGEQVVPSVKFYKLPYWHTTSYGFGNLNTAIGSYVYHLPGSYSPRITVVTLGGYSDTYFTSTVIAGTNCDTLCTGINLNATDTLMSDPCAPPMMVRMTVAGYVTGQYPTGDSVYLTYLFEGWGDSLHTVRVVHMDQLGGNSFHDTVDRPFTTNFHFPQILATTSSGRYSTAANLTFFVDDCTSSGITAYVDDSARHSLYCTPTLTNEIDINGALTGHAATAQSVKVFVDFGDGTDTTFTRAVLCDRYGNYNFGVPNDLHFGLYGSFENSVPVYHTYNAPGNYTVTVTDTALQYAGSGSGANILLANGCTPLAGTFYIDANQNCAYDQGMGEITLAYWPYALVDNTTGNTTYGYCDNWGQYSAYLITGDSYTLVTNPDSYFGTNAVPDSLHASCPATGTYTFTAGNSLTQDFGFTCSPPASLDMSVNGWGWGFVPGDTGFVSIWASSPTGYICDSLYSTVTLTLDPLLSFVGMWDGPWPTTVSGVSGNILTWVFSTASDLFNLDAHVMVAIDTTAGINAQICNTLTVTPSQLADPDTTNNLYTWCQPVKSSWDPNEKKASPQGSGVNGHIPMNTPLSYLIHFQNTGTAPAKNITIRDTIDQNMDMSTIQITNSSTFVQMYQDPNNVLRFRFNYINLPDSADDPDHSIGYVAYNISPKHGLAPGTKVTNNAGIYFDYNPAVITNTTVNTYQALGIITGPAFACLGTTMQLSDTTSGGIWSVNNSNATISSSGLLSAIHQGEVTVSYTIPGVGTTTKVINLQAIPSAGTITGPATICMDSSVTFVDVAPNGTWTHSNYNAYIYNGMLWATIPCIDTITYQVANSCAVATTSYIVTIVDCSTGVATVSSPSGLQIFPNPASTEITIKTNGLPYTGFSLTNSIGQVIMEEPLKAASTNVNIKLLPPGVYYFTFSGAGNKLVKKFVKM